MRPTTPGKRLNLGLAGIAVLATGLAIWPWVAPVGASGRAADAADAASSAPAIADLPPLTTFRVVFERPLFAPSRRPPADRAPVLGIGVTERYRLLGLVTAGEARRALLAEGTRRFEVAEGAALDDWIVARIEQGRVLLSSPSGEAELRLQRTSGNPVDPTVPQKPMSGEPVR